MKPINPVLLGLDYVYIHNYEWENGNSQWVVVFLPAINSKKRKSSPITSEYTKSSCKPYYRASF